MTHDMTQCGAMLSTLALNSSTSFKDQKKKLGEAGSRIGVSTHSTSLETRSQAKSWIQKMTLLLLI